MKAFKVIGAVLVLMFLIASSGFGSDAQTDGAIQMPRSSPAEGVLKVKGLYIGMKIGDACDIINKLLKDLIFSKGLFAGMKWRELHVVDFYGSFRLAPKGMDLPDAPTLLLLYIIADSNQNVTAIVLGPELVDKLFNTSDLDASDFAQQFLNAYHIPSLTSFATERPGTKQYVLPYVGWQYLSPNGYTLYIFEDKSMMMQMAPKASGRNFN